jgi:hypothetical protein
VKHNEERKLARAAIQTEILGLKKKCGSDGRLFRKEALKSKYDTIRDTIAEKRVKRDAIVEAEAQHRNQQRRI